MLKVKADEFNVSWSNELKLWKVMKIGHEGVDWILTPQLRSVDGEYTTYYNSDGSTKVKRRRSIIGRRPENGLQITLNEREIEKRVGRL